MRIQMLDANVATPRSLCTSPTFLPTLCNSGSNVPRPRMQKFQVELGQPLQPPPDMWMFCGSLLLPKLHRPQLRIWGVASRLVQALILESHRKATEDRTSNCTLQILPCVCPLDLLLFACVAISRLARSCRLPLERSASKFSQEYLLASALYLSACTKSNDRQIRLALLSPCYTYYPCHVNVPDSS